LEKKGDDRGDNSVLQAGLDVVEDSDKESEDHDQKVHRSHPQRPEKKVEIGRVGGEWR